MGKRILIYDECYVALITTLKKRRKKLYSQKEIAKLLNVSQRMISAYENCLTEINLRMLIDFCLILKIDSINLITKFYEEYLLEKIIKK